MSRRTVLARGWQLLALMGVYLGAAKIGLAIAPSRCFFTFFWPPAGVALAALLLGGYHLWPGIALAALLVDLWMVDLPPLVAAGAALGQTVAAVAAAVVLRRFLRFHGAMDRFRDVTNLAAVATASAMVSATIGAASLALGGVATVGFTRVWWAWSAGDLIGILVVAPPLLAWVHGPPVGGRWVVLAEAAALGALLAGCAVLVFGRRAGAASQIPILRAYLLYPPLIWAAVRFGPRGAATTILLVAAVGVWGTSAGRGPFVRADRAEGLTTLYGFFGATSLASLAVAAVVATCQRSVAELRVRESQLGAILEGTSDSLYVKDRRGRVLMMNSAGARRFGLSPDAMVGRDPREMLPPDEERRMREIDEEVMRTGEPRTFEAAATIAGQNRLYEVLKAPYRGGDGEVIGVVGISRDVTERKAAEVARAWLAAIVESSAQAIIGEALDGTIVSWNAAAERLYGYAREEIIGKPIANLVPPAEQDELASLLARVRQGEDVVNYETVRHRKDGRDLAVALTLSPVRGPAGEVIGVSKVARDISECTEMTRMAGEAAQLGMWFWNIRDDRLVWTPMCRRLFGVGPDEPVSYERWLGSLHADDRAETAAAIRRALDEHTPFTIEHRAVWPDGSVHWISGRGRTFCDDRGETVRMVGTALEITAQKQAEGDRAELLAQAEAARAEALAATQAKDEFLAVLSHELRTPLQAVLGWTEMLKGRLKDMPTASKGLAAIERNVKIQARLIEDLLDVSRIAAGKIRLARERVELAEVVAAAVESARAPAAESCLELDDTACPPCQVLGDPVRLQQVVANLLNNAVKFTPAGGRVAVRLERQGATVQIVVTDSGRGISAAFLPQVFERFRQSERTTVHARGGLGLGLAIVRHLVELHGGSVKVESAGEGRGATFTVTLPLLGAEQRAVTTGRRTPRATKTVGAVALDHKRVLVVDDDPEARDLLEAVLQEAGADVRAVGSAGAAVDAIASFHPEVLLSDIGMPGDDGYALLRRVRERESTEGGHVPAIALTAFASQGDREHAFDVGFEAYLAKPACAADLIAAVANLAGRAG